MTRFSISIIVRIVLLICCLVLFTVIFKLAETAEEPAPDTAQTEPAAFISDAVIPPELPKLVSPVLYKEIGYTKPVTRADADRQLDLVDLAIGTLEIECESSSYHKNAIRTMQAEIKRLKIIQNSLLDDIAKFTLWESEYSYATEVWYFLRENNYSEEVAAGILGNMMIETSGGSLALNPTIFSPTGRYYGLCQWSILYHPNVINKSFEEQLLYLKSSIEKEFKTFGKCYRKNFTYKDFLSLKTPEKAAHAFAAVYERCDPAGYTRRKQAARVAYNYFTSEVK